MTRYKVEAPDGSIIEIEGPDGATDEQLIQAAQAAYAQRQQSAATVPPPPKTPAITEQQPDTTLSGIVGSATRGIAPTMAGAALGAAAPGCHPHRCR